MESAGNVFCALAALTFGLWLFTAPTDLQRQPMASPLPERQDFRVNPARNRWHVCRVIVDGTSTPGRYAVWLRRRDGAHAFAQCNAAELTDIYVLLGIHYSGNTLAADSCMRTFVFT